jgi:SWI/SNF-related matrix-associated actin-dependent regulator of chromatin subfamily A-like protein 1
MELREYQKDGVQKILDILQLRSAAYLADEMGLGKTAEAIEVAQRIKAFTILIVCPASLRLNWARELKMWSGIEPFPILSSKAFSGLRVNGGCAVIISYDLAKIAVERFSNHWDLLVLDEVHYCKTSTTKRTKACLNHLWERSEYVLCMSGTPLPNGVMDGFTVFNKLAPDIFPNRYKYGFKYTNATRNWFTGGWEFKGGRNLKELRRLVAPFMVRRRKGDVLRELPPKVYTQVPLEVGGAADYRLSEEHEALVKSGELASVSSACATARRGLGLLKIPAAYEYIREVAAQKDRLVIFAYHMDVITTLSDMLAGSTDRASVIMGSTPMKERDEIVQDFQTVDGKSFILIAQIQAAGVGINLTAADTCIFAELDWVPANMAQAIDRLHRIGQLESVAIHYLVAAGTMDESIIGTLHQKIKAINEVLNG